MNETSRPEERPAATTGSVHGAGVCVPLDVAWLAIEALEAGDPNRAHALLLGAIECDGPAVAWPGLGENSREAARAVGGAFDETTRLLGLEQSRAMVARIDARRAAEADSITVASVRDGLIDELRRAA
jgi:hypothetical protein